MREGSYRSAMIRLSALASLAALAACGGGGGGGGDSSGGGVVPPGGITTPSSLTMPQAQMLAGRAASVVGLSANTTLISQQLVSLATSTAASSGTQPCALGGSVSFSRVDADGNNAISMGDAVSLTGANCRIAQLGGTSTLDGKVDAQVLAASGGGFYQQGLVWSLRTRQTYTSLTATANGQTIRLNGTLELDDSQVANTYRFSNFISISPVTQNALQVTSGDLFLNTNVNVPGDATRLTAQFSNVVVQTNLSATEKVNLTVPAAAAPQLRFNAAGQVIAGTLVAQLDKVKITVTVTAPNQVRVDVDNNNDGSIDATQTLAWASLLDAGAP